jgi:PAS domain S-box-containing protein
MEREKPQSNQIPAVEESRPAADTGNRSSMLTGWTGRFNSMKNSIDSLTKSDRPIEVMGRSLSIPNLLSILRLVSMPLLLYAAWTARPLFFQITLAIVLLLALADGVLARRLGQVTDFGAELDSWGVLAAYITIPLCAWILWPEIVRREAAFVIALVIFHVVPALLGLLKYGRLTSYHTWGSKLSAVLLSLTIFLILLGGPAWPFRAISPIVILSHIEEIFMTGILRQWQTNIPSLWHALRIEQGKVEKALQESEKRYREILLNIEDGYLELDLAGNLIFFNPTLCKYSGYSADELIGMNNRTLMDERQAKIAFETFNEVFRTGRSCLIQDWEFIRKDGQRRYFEGSINLMRNARGQPIGFRCFGRDTTERKLAEEKDRLHQEQLYQAGKMVALGTLVSGVAHEINNPNNFIMLNTPLLEEAWKGIRPILDEYYEEHGDFIIGGLSYSEMRSRIPTLFSGIVDGARRIEQIIEDLKNYVRKGTAELTEPVDINQVVKSALSLVSHMVRRSTHRFAVRYGKNLPPVNGNAQRLEQVIINLIQNACQALPDSQSGIAVSTAFDGSSRQIVLTVEDQGSGIPAENLPHITDTFYTTRYESGGVGLGLSISSKIVEEHGGHIRFASEPGQGTTVVVSLPVAGAKTGVTG